jgi:hypoxanthine phosphoribosyltransferase
MVSPGYHDLPYTKAIPSARQRICPHQLPVFTFDLDLPSFDDPAGAPTMRRTIPPTTRGVLEIDWPLFGELCRALALKVAREYDPEIILGIAKAGVIPGVVMASILQRDFSSMVVTRNVEDALPVLVTGPPPSVKGRRVLIVDETCDTGHTLRLALNEVKGAKPGEVRTAVSFKTGAYEPDFHSFETDKFIILPWDREIVLEGQLVTRPDYARYLQSSR